MLLQRKSVNDLKNYLVVWPHGANGDPRDIQRAMKTYLVLADTHNGDSDPNRVAVRMGKKSMRNYLVGNTLPGSAGPANGRALADADPRRVGIGLKTLSMSDPRRDATQMGKKNMKSYLVAQTKAGTRNPDLSAVSTQAPPFRFLLSYFYFKDSDLDEIAAMFDGQVDLFVDSGAYSAATSGSSIDVAAYIEWVRKWQHRVTAAASPDVIGDAVASARETERMLVAGLEVPILPVYHVGEDWKALERCLELSDYIALGGMVPFARRQKFLRSWIKKAFSFISEGKKVHGFGMTGWELMKAFPWYSVDSSSWTSGVRFGNFSLFDEKRGEMVDVDMRDKKGLLRNGALLSKYGLSARCTASKSASYDRDAIMIASLLSWQAAERWLNQRL